MTEASYPVEVTIEDAWLPLVSEQDQCVRNWLEERRDDSLVQLLVLDSEVVSQSARTYLK